MNFRAFSLESTSKTFQINKCQSRNFYNLVQWQKSWIRPKPGEISFNIWSFPERVDNFEKDWSRKRNFGTICVCKKCRQEEQLFDGLLSCISFQMICKILSCESMCLFNKMWLLNQRHYLLFLELIEASNISLRCYLVVSDYGCR